MFRPRSLLLCSLAMSVAACGQVLGLSDYEIDENAGVGDRKANGGGDGDTGGEPGDGDSDTGGESGDGDSDTGGEPGDGDSDAGGETGDGDASGGAPATGGDGSGGALGGASSGGTGGQTPLTKSTGEPCSQPDECTSTECVDGFCCQSACAGDCESCGLSGQEGACVPHEEGTDPDGDCGTLMCAADRSCASCENGVQDGDETDVDCGGGCFACPGGLVLSEIATSPNDAEFVEIYNPGPETVSLEHVYLADYVDYYQITGGGTVAASDFRVRFPRGAAIGAGEYLVISLRGGASFFDDFNAFPDYDMNPDDPSAPALAGEWTGSTSFTNTGEVAVLFFWDGSSDLVRDIDIIVYEPSATVADAETVDKTGITSGTSMYLPDTSPASQAVAPAPDTDESIVRCNLTEGSETQSGGNGFLGHDETSENLAATWLITTTRTPGAANVCN